MAWYSKAVRKALPLDTSKDPRITPRVVILHVADSEADSLFSYFKSGSGGVESHFYVKYDGTIEQYRDTAYQADANVDANGFAISIESQGKANGTWTAAQLASIKNLLTWIHQTHGVPLVKCPKWDGSGVGYHVQFESHWDKRGASCPGPNRIKQFENDIVPWMKGEDVPSADEIKRAIFGADEFKGSWMTNPKNPTWSFKSMIIYIGEWALAARNQAKANAAAIAANQKAIASLQSAVLAIGNKLDALPADVIDALGQDYEAQVVLTPKDDEADDTA